MVSVVTVGLLVGSPLLVIDAARYASFKVRESKNQDAKSKKFKSWSILYYDKLTGSDLSVANEYKSNQHSSTTASDTAVSTYQDKLSKKSEKGEETRRDTGVVSISTNHGNIGPSNYQAPTSPPKPPTKHQDQIIKERSTPSPSEIKR